MTGNFRESQTDIESTDELPVLSEEALLRIGRDAGLGVDTLPRTLEASVETLRSSLEHAEARWAGLESTIEQQNRAIAFLTAALGDRDREGQDRSRETPEPPEHAPNVAVAEPAPQSDSTTAAEAAPPLSDPGVQPARPDAPGAVEKALLERIAALESYIAGRADRWRAMEDELLQKSAQIAELEQELEQRVAREQRLSERLHIEGGKSDGLRERLQRLTRRLETAEQRPFEREPDATREVPAATRADDRLRHSALDAPGSQAPAGGSGAALIGFSQDVPARTPLDRDIITIGRGEDCDIFIAAHSVSRKHATLRQSDGRWIVEDKGSLNGVFVNSERVSRRELEPGDWIVIGESRFRFVGGTGG